eukprot:s3451_g4.t1
MAAKSTVNQAELEAVEAAAKRTEGVSPMTSNEKKKDESDEDTAAVRAAKRARLGDEEEKEELEVDAKSIKLCLEECQRALDYVARQRISGQSLRQLPKVLNGGCSTAGEHMKNATWQLTGNKHEAKTTLKSLVQQLVTCANNGNNAVKEFD